MRTSIALLAVTSAMFGLLAQTPPKVKTVPIQPTSATSGKEMFVAYCAACHGPDGRGNGPAASALKKPPADLTRLAANNGGKYPDLKVADTLSAKDVPAHGSQEMPVWGNLFKTLGSGRNDQVQLRITNLTSYIKSIQVQ
jgi:mono/diheme cytochrome c family protein